MGFDIVNVECYITTVIYVSGVGEKWLGDKHQEVYYNSKDPQDPENVVLYYVYPALKHKDYVMKIGTVFTGPKQKVAKSAEKDIEEDDK